MKHDFVINNFIADDLAFNSSYFDTPENLYPTLNSDDLDLRIRLHQSKDYSKDPSLIEVIIPTSSESFKYSIPFCDNIKDLGEYYDIPGVYVFYGLSNSSKQPIPLYVGESEDLLGRVIKHISGTSNLKSVSINGKNFEPFKYIRWVEFYTLDTDNKAQKKLLEQVIIATKKPLHNYHTEKRNSTAKHDYYKYLSTEQKITEEISIKWSQRTWHMHSLENEYYIEKYGIKNPKKKIKTSTNFLNFINSKKGCYNPSNWKF